MKPFRVYMGWDSREDIAFQVARKSLLRRTSVPVEVFPIRRQDLVQLGVYRRKDDPLASTEFTYTRFLTPYLDGYEGWTLFCDCDFLFLADIAELLLLQEDHLAVRCVQHDYQPLEAVKMDGKMQTQYPRKNWSSFMLMNGSHPATKSLTPDIVNNASAAFLHRMQWVDDAFIGDLDPSWNWLEGWSKRPASGQPKAVHFTRGGPWFANYQDVEFAAEWIQEAEELGFNRFPDRSS